MFSFHGLTKGQWDTFDLLKRSDTHYPSLQFLAQLLTQVVLLAMALLDSAFRLMVHQYRILAINSSSERQKNYISCIVCIVVTWHKVSSNQDTYIDTSLDTSLNRRVYSRSAYRLSNVWYPSSSCWLISHFYVISVMYFGRSYLLGTYAISDVIIGSSLGLYNIPTWS